MARAFIGVGSNIEPAENVRRSLRLLAQQMRIVAISTVYETQPEGRRRQPRYYDCVVAVETEAQPLELKRSLREIEARLGRVRSEDRYAPRIIDLDLLIYDDLVAQTGEMTLPDPEIAKRPYLAAGLAELGPELALPGTKLTMRSLAAKLPEQGMRPLDEYTAALRREVT